MFVEFMTVHGERLMVNGEHVTCFYAEKACCRLVMLDGSSWALALPYAQLCAIFNAGDYSADKTCKTYNRPAA